MSKQVEFKKLFEYIEHEVSRDGGDGDAIIFLRKTNAEEMAKEFLEWAKEKNKWYQNHSLHFHNDYWNVTDRSNENFMFTNKEYEKPPWFTVIIQAW